MQMMRWMSMQRSLQWSGGPERTSKHTARNNVYLYTSSLNYQAGILCQEGEYTLKETERVHDVLHQYQTVGGYTITTSTPYGV